MREFANGRLVFDVDDSGPPEGDAMVLLHGHPENRTSWAAVTPRLVEAGFRVLAPDQRGYSPRARPHGRAAYRVDLLVDDVVALLDAAAIARAHVVGHDLGGAVAWAIAARRPDRLRSLTSLTTPHPRAVMRAVVTGDQALRSWYVAAFQLPWLPELAFRPGNDRWLSGALERTGLPPETVERFMRPLQEPGAATAAIHWYRALPLSLARRSGGPVRVPTLFVYPTGDAFVGRRAADLTGRYVEGPYRYEVLDGCSHWLPEAAPDLVARLVVEHARANC